jgi:hypothetical protein
MANPAINPAYINEPRVTYLQPLSVAREIATTTEINGSLHGPLHGNFQLSRGIMDEERRQVGYQGKH